MIGTALLPKNLQSKVASSRSHKLGWIGRHVSHWLETVSCAASKHPLHTLVIVAVLASSTYVSLLEGSLFRTSVSLDAPLAGADVQKLLAGSKKLWVGEKTDWKWQLQDDGNVEVSAEGPLTTVGRKLMENHIRQPMILHWLH